MRYMICIGVFAGDGTSTVRTPVAEKMELIKLCYESAKREGVPIQLFATGDPEIVRRAIPGIPLHGVKAEASKQLGEQAIVARMIAEAKKAGCNWIVKVAGDTFHPARGWSARMTERGEQWGPENSPRLIATAHSRPDWVNTQVFAARVDFLEATWPGANANFQRIGIEAQWGERIAAAGLRSKWHQLPSKPLVVDGCTNWIPIEDGLVYHHAHTLASARGWALKNWDIHPDPKVSVSIVIPARNECDKDHKGRFVLPGTVDSILETSVGMPAPEIIAVDDGSDKALPPWPKSDALRVIRNPQPLGVDGARNVGLSAAHGDVVGILDGHMRVETQQQVPCMHGVQKAATLAMQRNAIVVCRCAHLELPTHPGTPPLCGGVFIPLRSPDQQLAVGWNHFSPPEGVRRINSLLGASYFAPRAQWERLQYFVNDCRCWGYSEEGLALKAAFLDIPIYFYGDVTISHWFRKNGPHPFTVDGFHKFVNRARVLKVAFDPQTFNDVWLPRLKKYRWNADWDAAMGEHALRCEAARFHARKVKTDKEVLKEIFEYPS